MRLPFPALALSIAALTSLAPLATLAQQATPTPPGPLGPDAPFTVAMNTSTIEGSPVYVAAAGSAGARLSVVNGGVRNLANGSAHAATNAETQFLIAGTPNVRLLFTVAEGLYRVVAKRSAGIRSAADHFPVISRSVNQTVDWVARSWQHHAFPMAVPADLLDVMTEEERWVARNQNREARTRAALAAFIDTSVLDEARRSSPAR